MNEIARLVPFLFDDYERFSIIDREGNPWFVARDVATILGITYYRQTISSFPENEKAHVVCAVISNDGSSIKPGTRKTQKMLIINRDGLFRLVMESRKPQAKQIRNRFIEILSEITKKGINRASLPKTWSYAGEDNLTYAQWRDRREKAFFRRHPDATLEDFLKANP